jgi:predicted DNA-binding antitoxin AbrB/MazE fold protein
MVKSVEGIYRNGKVELLQPLDEAEGSRVIVTLVRPAEPVDLRQRGIDQSQAADLRHRLARFAEGWDRPEMAAYDERRRSKGQLESSRG